MSKIRDRRFTVSVAADVADRLDEYVTQSANTNRSEVVEQALRLWDSLAEFRDNSAALHEAIKLYQKQQERELYKSYYANLSDAAKKEDASWSELSKETVTNEWPVPNPIIREQRNK
jgi:Arc/MetJ-type ribon-helix-helix transcriptional regulator